MYKDLNPTTLAYQIQANWYSVASTDTSVNSWVCEQDGLRCDGVPQAGNATTTPNKNYLNLTVTISCLDGYLLSNYPVNATTSQYYNQYQTCVADPSDPTKGMWSNTTLVPCVPKMCTENPSSYATTGGVYPTCTICVNSVCTNCSTPQPPFYPATTANYTCQPGYQMAYGNTTVQTVTCGNNPNDPLSNTWKPSATICVPVKCPSLATIAPNNSLSPSGVDVTGKKIMQGASQYFTYYGSVINFTCIPGYIYADGLITRLYRCNAIQTVGYWTIVTQNAGFYSAGCNTIVCPNMTRTVTNYVNGGGLNVTSGDPAQTSYMSKFTLTCATNWAFPDGTTSKTLTCSAIQSWSDGTNSYTQVPGCTQNAQNFANGAIPGQAFEPPHVESASAAADSSTIFVILGFVLTLLLIMDLAVLPRDVGILRYNVARLRERCGSKPADEEKQDFSEHLSEPLE